MGSSKVIYQGRRNGEGSWIVERLEHVGERIAISALPHHVRHSPAGYAWGYHGSGPAELARCLLIDVLGDEGGCERCLGSGRDPSDDDGRCLECWGQGFGPVVEANYQHFKREVIARLTQDDRWSLTASEIRAWVKARPDQPGSAPKATEGVGRP